MMVGQMMTVCSKDLNEMDIRPETDNSMSTVKTQPCCCMILVLSKADLFILATCQVS